ncbi:hypothetical protein SDC9_159119 [bioreactor metagenome]|uniref:Uncharacterized protein n=1 Tax=bioreactor metagenome TaxID=1076179 RepID=A0A645FBX5_9ZZZZ
MIAPCIASVATGVGNKEYPLASVSCADSRSFKIKHDDVIAETLQVLDNVGSGNMQDSRYILTDDPTRRKFSDNS